MSGTKVALKKKSEVLEQESADSQKAFVNSEFTGSFYVSRPEIKPASTPSKSENSYKLPPVSGDIPDWSGQAIQSLLLGLKSVDELTYDHCLRVGQSSRLLARAAGLSDYQQKVAEAAGFLHDVGKMGIDKSIIHKPSRLNESEYHAMMTHPVLSEKIIQPFSSHDFFKAVIPAVRNHHEWINGTGYPDRLTDENIPLLSRIILIVDTLDAMSMNRSYRKSLSLDVIYSELRRYSGEQFDEQLVKVFLESHKFWASEVKDPSGLSSEVLKKRAA